MNKKVELITASQLNIVRDLAYDIWPDVYSEMITTEQIDFMLEMMYNQDTLRRDVERGVQFYVLSTDEQPVGFFAIEPNTPTPEVMRLHKLYLKKSFHGSGLGKFMLDNIELNTKAQGLQKINLNVNRNNPTVLIYKKQGYTITMSEDITIGDGYLMEDYQMEKVL